MAGKSYNWGSGAGKGYRTVLSIFLVATSILIRKLTQKLKVAKRIARLLTTRLPDFSHQESMELYLLSKNVNFKIGYGAEWLFLNFPGDIIPDRRPNVWFSRHKHWPDICRLYAVSIVGLLVVSTELMRTTKTDIGIYICETAFVHWLYTQCTAY